jgi:hypothetical protein
MISVLIFAQRATLDFGLPGRRPSRSGTGCTGHERYGRIDAQWLKITAARRQGWRLAAGGWRLAAGESGAFNKRGICGRANSRLRKASVAAINVSGQAMRTSATVMADSLLPQLLAASQAMAHPLSAQRV